MRKGYVHPYHSADRPINLTYLHYLKTLYEAVGPEQVSPHYETLSRSRRGIIFLGAYVAVIMAIARMGGWSHNEWLRAMVWHHEYLICLFLGYVETRHFTAFIGPKFTIWYSVYANYETEQLASQWADTCEEAQLDHLREAKQQLEYSRIHKEYDFVKKRSLINFLTNEKLNLEAHFHERTVNMLNSVQRYERQNLDNHIQRIAQESLDVVLDQVKNTKKDEF